MDKQATAARARVGDEGALVASDPSRQLSVLRVYLRRRRTLRRPGVRGWWNRVSLAQFLVEEALKVGVLYGTVTLGYSGFVHGAKHVAMPLPEVPNDLLPSCVELVGDSAVLAAFVDAFEEELADAVMVRFDGIEISVPARV